MVISQSLMILYRVLYHELLLIHECSCTCRGCCIGVKTRIFAVSYFSLWPSRTKECRPFSDLRNAADSVLFAPAVHSWPLLPPKCVPLLVLVQVCWDWEYCTVSTVQYSIAVVQLFLQTIRSGALKRGNLTATALAELQWAT